MVLFSLFDGFVDNGQESPFVLAFIHSHLHLSTFLAFFQCTKTWRDGFLSLTLKVLPFVELEKGSFAK